MKISFVFLAISVSFKKSIVVHAIKKTTECTTEEITGDKGIGCYTYVSGDEDYREVCMDKSLNTVIPISREHLDEIVAVYKGLFNKNTKIFRVGIDVQGKDGIWEAGNGKDVTDILEGHWEGGQNDAVVDDICVAFQNTATAKLHRGCEDVAGVLCMQLLVHTTTTHAIPPSTLKSTTAIPTTTLGATTANRVAFAESTTSIPATTVASTTAKPFTEAVPANANEIPATTVAPPNEIPPSTTDEVNTKQPNGARRLVASPPLIVTAICLVVAIRALFNGETMAQ